MRHHLRIARPVSDLSRSGSMYRAGLGLCLDARVLSDGPALLSTKGVQYGKARP